MQVSDSYLQIQDTTLWKFMYYTSKYVTSEMRTTETISHAVQW